MLKQHTSSGSNRIDSAQSDPKNFSVLGIRIPASVATLSANEIERAYKSIFEETYFNPNTHPHLKETFTFLTLTKGSKTGNHIVKHVRDELKSALREQLACDNDADQIVVLVSSSRMKSLEILGKLRLALADLIDTKNKV